jgi:hypothetical protein
LDLFNGPNNRLRPKVKPSNIASGLLKVFGIIVGHALILDQVAFPYLSSSIYYYMVGKPDVAITLLLDCDVDGLFSHSINKVIFLV